jgi:esterase/lipase superfamily enzyme
MDRLRTFTIGFLVGLILLACTPRGAITVVATQASNGTVAPIFVATTRALSQSPFDFSRERSAKVRMAQYDISVPPTHQQGKVEWPKGTPDMSEDMVTLNVHPIESRREFIKSANKYKKHGEEAVVFIHGYNNTFAEGLYRFAQVATDVDVKGPKYHYSWPSAGDARGYIYDRDSVLFARDGLEQLLNDVASTNTDGIFIVAHSIGAALLVETLRQMSIAGKGSLNGKLRGIIMISPDIDVDVFTESLKRIQPRPNPLLIFVSKNDLALKFSSFLTGNQNRLGLIENLDALKGTNVEIIDVSAFDDGDGFLNHSVAITSPTVLNLLRNREIMETILDPSSATKKGTNIISRVVQTVNDVTQIILNPKAAQ